MVLQLQEMRRSELNELMEVTSTSQCEAWNYC